MANLLWLAMKLTFRKQVLDGRSAAIADGQTGGIGVIHKPFHHQILDPSGLARFGLGAAVKGPRVVHGHREPVFDQNMTGAAEVIIIVMILLLAVDDLEVAGGEIVACQ